MNHSSRACVRMYVRVERSGRKCVEFANQRFGDTNKQVDLGETKIQ